LLSLSVLSLLHLRSTLSLLGSTLSLLRSTLHLGSLLLLELRSALHGIEILCGGGLSNEHNSFTELVLVETFFFFVFLKDFDGLINSDTNLAGVADHKLFHVVFLVEIVSSSLLSDRNNVHLCIHIVSTLGINEEFMGNTLGVHEEHVSCELRVGHGFNLSFLLTPCLSLAGLTLTGLSLASLALTGLSLAELALAGLSLAHLVGALGALSLIGLSCLSMVHFNDKEDFFSLTVSVVSSTMLIDVDIFKSTSHLVGDTESSE